MKFKQYQDMCRPQIVKDRAMALRKAIQMAGVKARVRMTPGAGRRKSVQVFVPSYGETFSPSEQKTIQSIAKDMGLTYSMGLEIDTNATSHPEEFEFYIC